MFSKKLPIPSIKIFVYGFFVIFFAQALNAQTQTITGNGNVAVSGNKNEVNTNTSLIEGVVFKGLSNYNSKMAKADLEKGNYKKVIFEAKQPLKSDKKKLLIMTATNYETQKIHEAAQKVNLKIVKKIVNDQVFYSMGSLGGVEILHMQPGMMGMLEPGSTPLALMSGFHDIKPHYVISTGIAFGRQSKGQKLGDILVSRQIANYETRKERNGDIYFRGDKVTSPMLRHVNAGIISWQGVNIHQGLVLSGNVLVNSKKFLDHLSKREPEYAGGDMESYGIYAVSSMMGAKWIMIKGISDWGDGTKNDDSHEIALENAGHFIFHFIKEGTLE